MRLPWSFARRSAFEPPPTARRFAVDRQLLFDPAYTRTLAALMELPRGRRDTAWTASFFDAAWNAALVVAQPAVITRRDGFPCLRLNLPPPGRFKPAAVANLAALCLERATGIALFSDAADPIEAAQQVFSPGTLDSLVRFDTWLGDPLDDQEPAGQEPAGQPPAGALEEGWGRTMAVQDARQVLLGSPSVQYLPTYTARALLNHLRGACGIADPRVRLLVDPKLRPACTLVIGQKRSAFATADAWDMLRGRLLWFLPPGRAVMPMPEDWRLEDMTPLEQLAGQAPGPVG